MELLQGFQIICTSIQPYFLLLPTFSVRSLQKATRRMRFGKSRRSSKERLFECADNRFSSVLVNYMTPDEPFFKKRIINHWSDSPVTFTPACVCGSTPWSIRSTGDRICIYFRSIAVWFSVSVCASHDSTDFVSLGKICWTTVFCIFVGWNSNVTLLPYFFSRSFVPDKNLVHQQCRVCCLGNLELRNNMRCYDWSARTSWNTFWMLSDPL